MRLRCVPLATAELRGAPGPAHGLTDLPMPERGERDARRLAERLLAGIRARVHESGNAGADLRARGVRVGRAMITTWFEGLGSTQVPKREILAERPAEVSAMLPGRESPDDVAARTTARPAGAPSAATCCILERALLPAAARWLGLTPAAARTSCSARALERARYDHDLGGPGDPSGTTRSGEN